MLQFKKYILDLKERVILPAERLVASLEKRQYKWADQVNLV